MATKRSFAHGLDFTRAKRVADLALLDYRTRLTKYALTVTWVTPDTADVGFIILDTCMGGQIKVTPTDIEIHVDVPLKFKLFEGAAAQIVKGEVQACVERAKCAGVV